MRLKAKRDAVEPDIVTALLKAGATVTKLSQRGVLDLLVGWNHRFMLMECKSEDGELTDDQVAFMEYHSGCPMRIVRTPAEALLALKELA